MRMVDNDAIDLNQVRKSLSGDGWGNILRYKEDVC